MLFYVMKCPRRNTDVIQQVCLRLKQIRISKCIKQETVRYDLNMNIARIESGCFSVSLSTLADLCDYYEYPFEDLFKGIKTQL